jgi:hypothetical protein
LYEKSGEKWPPKKIRGEFLYLSFFDVMGCIELSDAPFYILGEEKKLYIAPWSEMIDAGYGMAEDGMGTCHNQPDIGQMDIGCHFPIGVSGSFGIPSSPADFNQDGIINTQKRKNHSLACKISKAGA